jgi:hypothetical protein
MTHVDIFGKSDVRFGKFPESIESHSNTKIISNDYIIPANQENHIKDSDITTTNLIVDSRDRLHDDYANPSKYTIKLPDTITNIVNIELIGAEIPKTHYNINEYNNKVEFTVGGGAVKTVTIAEGNYTEAELVTALNDDDLFKASLVISYDAKTRKFSIVKESSNTATTILLFEGEDEKYNNRTRKLYKANTMGKVLGYNIENVQITTTALAGSKQADLNHDKYVMLKIKDLGTIHGIFMGVEDAFAKIVLDNEFGTIKYLKMADIGRRFIKTFSPPLGKLNDLEIEFRTYDNNLYNFNGVDHCLFFKITTLKQSMNYYS